MRSISSLFLIFAFAAIAAAEDNLEKARESLLAGRYEEAAEMFERTAKENPAAAIGLARSREERGQYDEAFSALEGFEKDAAVSAEIARLAFGRGDYSRAQAAVDAALKADSEQSLARWIAAELHRVHGRLDEAESGYRRQIRFYNDNDIDDPETLRWIGAAAAQYARWNRQSNQFDFLINELYADALKLRDDYWPAKYETGLLFLEKYNYASAAEEFRAALNMNPQSAETHAALAQVWLAQRDVAKAESEIERALEINPSLLDAWLAKADIAWANLASAEALELLEKKALPINPSNEETLGKMAACYLILDGAGENDSVKDKSNATRPSPPAPTTSWCPPLGEGRSRFEAVIKKVTSQNPHAGEFFYVLAQALEAHNKQPQAEKYYREAIRAMPKLIGPQARLGLLFMQSGREAEARPMLKEAYDGDPFNVRVHNMLNLLIVLDKMQRKETEHCLVRFEKDDSLLGAMAEKRVEGIFRELSDKFGFTPPKKTAIDIFNQAEGQGGHAWFSTRVSGLPFIGTVAASTGHLVAMVSPNDSQARKKYNWIRVLKHELVHVINLQQTHFNITHWFTEGLAVSSENHPRPAEWNQLLKSRLPKGKLFNLDTIETGFTRPDASGDWAMAYCQAELYVDYMRQLGGDAAILKMIDAYTQGANTEESLRRTFGKTKADFEKGYLEFVSREVEKVNGLRWADAEDIVELKKSAEEQPQDSGAQAELANGYIYRGAEKEAAEQVEKSLKLEPGNPLAIYVKARLVLKGEKKEKNAEAMELLEKAIDLKSPEPNGLNLLAGLKFKAERYEEATRLYALGEKLDPANPQWARSLARVYLATENKEKLAETLGRVAEADVDDLSVRKKLAQLALAKRDYGAAERWAGEALEIDLRDAESHAALAESLGGRHNNEEAIEEWKIAVELAPEKPQPRFALADAYYQTGQKEKAKEELEKLLEISPDYSPAKTLLESIKKE